MQEQRDTQTGRHKHFLGQTKQSYLSKHRVHYRQQVYRLCLLHLLHISPLPSCQHLLQLLVHNFAFLCLLLCHLRQLSGLLKLLKWTACSLCVNTSLSLSLHLLLDGSLHLRGQGGQRRWKRILERNNRLFSHTNWWLFFIVKILVFNIIEKFLFSDAYQTQRFST